MRAINILGSKVSNAHRYPAPKHDTIVEPFAGGAGYSLLHWERQVVLVDMRRSVFEVWRYLIDTDPAEILELPMLAPGQHVRELDVSDGARRLISWCVNQSSGPRNTLSGFSEIRPGTYWSEKRRKVASEIARRVKHWRVFQASCFDIPSSIGPCTWFVDPPYAHIPTAYGTPALDYVRLANWCRERIGQTIVCERADATWLPFRPLYDAPTTMSRRGRARCPEAIWCST